MGHPSFAHAFAIDADTRCDRAAPLALGRNDQVAEWVSGLALAVTDRSDLACRLWPDSLIPLPRQDLLTIEEIDRIVTTFVHLGVRRIRLAGGDPLVRRGIGTLVRILCRHLATGAADEVILSTHGTRLADLADTLAASGLRHIEVWLPSRDEERFQYLCPGGDLATVLAGIACAAQAGLSVRLNTVLLPGFNDDELHSLIEWCGEAGVELCLVEPQASPGVSPLALRRVRAALARHWRLEPTDPVPVGPQLRSMGCCFRVGETAGRAQRPPRQSPGGDYARVTTIGQFYCHAAQVEAIDLRRVLRVGPRGLGMEGLIRAATRPPPMLEPLAGTALA